MFLYSCAETPSTIQEYVNQGDRQLRQGQIAEAIASYRMALHKDTLNADVLARLGRAYESQGKGEAADMYLRRAMNITYEEGVAALEAGRDSAALAAFEHTLEIFPRHPLALNQLAELHLARGQTARALGYYEESALANPDFSLTFIRLGQLYAQEGQHPKAEQAYARAIAININALQAYLGLGQLYLEAERWTDAAEQFDKALLIHPESEAARQGLDQARLHL